MLTRHGHDLLVAAREVLVGNDTGVFVKPGPDQYPGQWNWDAAFTVIGLTHFDPVRARQEVRTLLHGQWDDGMVPHIVFHQPNADYFPGPSMWGTTVGTVATSGVTQPPLLATAVAHLHRRCQDPDFLIEVLPAIERWHRWFHRRRTMDSGLVRILHPWESGMDNSPRFDHALSTVPPPADPFERRDRVHVTADQRPSDEDYQAYLSLLASLRRCGYRPPANTALFEVGDVFTTAILARAERDLAGLWKTVGGDGTPASERALHLERALRRAWDGLRGMFCDTGTDPQLTIGSVMAAVAVPGHPGMDRLVTGLEDPATFGPSAEAPWYPTSVPKDDPAFEPLRYWRGPVWANVNWLLAEGLADAGHHLPAKRLRNATLDLVAEHGFWEYYDPFTGQGLGSERFSWTAAVVIDILSPCSPT